MKIKKAISLFIIFLFLYFLVIETEVAVKSAKDALFLCVNAIIPTLFPFFVVSGLLQNLGFISLFGKLLAPVSRILFKTSGKGAVVFLLGVLCGYPTGAKVIADMCKNNALTKKEGARLLSFCNNSGPLFVIGAVGCVMMGSHHLGVILYVIHVLSAVLVGVLLRNRADWKAEKKVDEICTLTFSEAVTKSVENAVLSTLSVCGYVVVFSLLCAFFSNDYITPLLEVTTGVNNLVTSGMDSRALLIFTSGAISFGGICVLFQVMSATSGTGISLKQYIFGKIMQGVISMLITTVYVYLFNIQPVFAQRTYVNFTSYLPVVLFLLCALIPLVRLTKKC